MVTNNKSGQAMVELIVALVAIMAIIAALLQITSLGLTDTHVLLMARKDASSKSILPIQTLSSAGYLKTWEEGADSSSYTVDDIAIEDEPLSFINMIVNKASADEAGWELYGTLHNNPFGMLRSSFNPSSVFGFVQGEHSESVVLLPATRHLLYNADVITLKSRVWLVRINDVY